MNSLRDVRVEKVVVNIGVGEAGERLSKACKVLEMVTGQKPIQTISKTVNRDLGIREGMPLGCKVTLRGEDAEKFLALGADRLGTSRIIKIVKNEKATGY